MIYDLHDTVGKTFSMLHLHFTCFLYFFDIEKTLALLATHSVRLHVSFLKKCQVHNIWKKSATMSTVLENAMFTTASILYHARKYKYDMFSH